MQSHNVFKSLKFLGPSQNLCYVKYSSKSTNGQFLRVKAFLFAALLSLTPSSETLCCLTGDVSVPQVYLLCWISRCPVLHTYFPPSRPQAASALVTHISCDLEWQRILRNTWCHHLCDHNRVSFTFVIITEFLCQSDCSLLQRMSSCGVGLLVSCALQCTKGVWVSYRVSLHYGRRSSVSSDGNSTY